MPPTHGVNRGNGLDANGIIGNGGWQLEVCDLLSGLLLPSAAVRCTGAPGAPGAVVGGGRLCEDRFAGRKRDVEISGDDHPKN